MPGPARRDKSFLGELRRWRDMALAVLASPTGLRAFEALDQVRAERVLTVKTIDEVFVDS